MLHILVAVSTMISVGSFNAARSSRSPDCWVHTWGGCCDVDDYADNAWGTWCPEPWPSAESYFCEVSVVDQEDYFGMARTTLGYTADRVVSTPNMPAKTCEFQRPYCDQLSPTGCSHYEETITIRCNRSYSVPIGSTNCTNEL